MRDLEFFPTYTEYVEHLWNDVFTEPWVAETSFYANLIHFVADHYAPIFYTQTDRSEHFAFSGAYHFETRRQRYPDKNRECLFWLHDFTHMLFPYAWDVYNVSERDFLEQFRYQEWLASTETEIFAYYRVPGLRERVFPNEKLYYDVIQERGSWGDPQLVGHALSDVKPDTTAFLGHRRRLVLDDAYGERELGEFPEILAFFQKWRTLTPKWINERYRSLAGKRIHEFPWRRLNGENYERIISKYDANARPSEDAREHDYRSHTMANVVAAYDLLGWDNPPTRWRHIPDALGELEGAVFFKSKS
jgi:hypothetical protein